MRPTKSSLLAIVVSAVFLRLAVRLYTGPMEFWENGYTFYFALAQNIAAGRGLTFDGHAATAFRVPLYPLFLAAVTVGRATFLPIVLAQAIIGAGTVACGALLAAELFGFVPAALTAVFAAGYPYYVVHDTAMQETSLFTFLTALSVLLLVRARRRMSFELAVAAGLVLAADVMTRSTIAPFAAFAPIWLGWAAGRGPKAVRVAILCAATLAVGILPWLARSYVLTGAPMLGTEAGYSLWRGNNPNTFSYYPVGSIDQSEAVAVQALSAGDAAELAALGGNDAAVDRWFLRKGIGFIRDNPWLAVGNGFRKLWAAFSFLPSPRRSLFPTVVYAVSYGSIMVFGLAGMMLTWRSWREHAVIYALFGSFAIVTAVFFGHTSHRSFLDVYWMGYAAYTVTWLAGRQPNGAVSTWPS